MSTPCVHFAALPCVAGKKSQQWVLSDSSFQPGGGADASAPMTIRWASSNGTNQSCWEAQNCGWGGGVAVTKGSGGGFAPPPTQCDALPPAGWQPENASAHHSGCAGTFPQAWILHGNGTIGLAMRPGSCLQMASVNGNPIQTVQIGKCSTWKPKPPRPSPSPPGPHPPLPPGPHPHPPPHPPPPPPAPAPPPSKDCVFLADTDYHGGGMGGALVSNSSETCCAQWLVQSQWLCLCLHHTISLCVYLTRRIALPAATRKQAASSVSG